MNLGAQELLQLAQAAGSGGDPQTAVAVALAESGGDPTAIGQNSDGSHDRGLWQINDKAHPDVSDGCAFDPTCNARAAYVISNGWTDFTPWTTFQSGAYRQYMPSVSTAEQPAPPQRSLYGQSVVGQTVTSPWFPGVWEVTQGWGPTDYDGEPEGHGYSHWHAGIDIGLDCGTTISLPMGMSGTVRALDNPGGYGTALVILPTDGSPGVLLGHLRQRLVDDGSPVQGGAQLAISNNTGNSTGCHLHFEVRPQDRKSATGLGRYGTDIDPSSFLTSGQAGTSTELFSASSNPAQGFADAASRAVATIAAGGQVLLGAGMLLGGLLATAYGMRGQGPQELQRDVARTTASLRTPKRRPAPQGPPEPTGAAAESRIRPDLQQSRTTRERRSTGASSTLPRARPVHAGTARLTPGERRRLGLPT